MKPSSLLSFPAGYMQDVKDDLIRSKRKSKNWTALAIHTASRRIEGKCYPISK